MFNQNVLKTGEMFNMSNMFNVLGKCEETGGFPQDWTDLSMLSFFLVLKALFDWTWAQGIEHIEHFPCFIHFLDFKLQAKVSFTPALPTPLILPPNPAQNPQSLSFGQGLGVCGGAGQGGGTGEEVGNEEGKGGGGGPQIPGFQASRVILE